MGAHAHQNYSYKNPYKNSFHKGFIQPFTASIKPVDNLLRNFNTNSVRLHSYIDLLPPVDFVSTVFLRV